MYNQTMSNMKTDMTEVGKLLKIGLTFGFALTLVSCGTDRTTGVEEVEVEDETEAVTTEETATFEGMAAGADRALYDDFTTARFIDRWDANNDNMLSKNEYTKSLFEAWDVNNDNMLDENEWTTATDDFGFAADNKWAMAAWDANSNKKISMAEFNTKLDEAGIFARLDKNNDGMLDEREYAEGTVGFWNDADADGLDENKYREIKSRYFEEEERAYRPERG